MSLELVKVWHAHCGLIRGRRVSSSESVPALSLSPSGGHNNINICKRDPIDDASGPPVLIDIGQWLSRRKVWHRRHCA
eukprot:3568741-Amphidinium_carterae.1